MPADNIDKHAESTNRHLYDCYDCENTYATMCDRGMYSVCYFYHDTNDWGFTSNAFTAIRKLCKKFSKACDQKDAAEACDGYCEDTDNSTDDTNDSGG